MSQFIHNIENILVPNESIHVIVYPKPMIPMDIWKLSKRHPSILSLQFYKEVSQYLLHLSHCLIMLFNLFHFV